MTTANQFFIQLAQQPSTDNIASGSQFVSVNNNELVINKSREIEFTRFKKRPEEMVRRLMLEVVGAEELKTMTALGFSRGGKPGKGIPTDVRNAVFSMCLYFLKTTLDQLILNVRET